MNDKQLPTTADLRIKEVTAYPISFPLRPEDSVTLGVGRAVKRDSVVVKVVTEGGLVGWGESHHGRAHSAVAKLVNTTLRLLVVGMNAADTVGVWKKIYDKQLASHGMGAGTCLAMSGIDMALWDIRGKAVGWPLYKLLGGSDRPIPAYAGGVSLADARAVMPGLDDKGVAWLEEPFPAHDYRSYELATSFGQVPLAAGENHYTRYEFNRVIEDGAITILQPDLSKTGGITEALRIAAMASAYKLPIHPHTSMTGLNMAASIHFLAAIDNGGYFEGDVSKNNKFRDELVTTPYVVGSDGCVRPLEKPGIGVEVNEDFIASHPAIDGPSYV
jgi:D-galactarolactone cycloisomerase